MIIGINGYSGSGKDTIGKIIQDIYPNDHWKIKKFAGKLKQIGSLLTGIPIKKFEDQDFKKTNLGQEWWTTCDEGWQPMTVRDFLQKLGTDGLRNGLHDNVWVNALMADYKKIEYGDDEQGHYPNWVITDTRFPNEAKAIKEKGGIIIRVNRPGVGAINQHPSETSLDDYRFDYIITNDSDIASLTKSIKTILQKTNQYEFN